MEIIALSQKAATKMSRAYEGGPFAIVSITDKPSPILYGIRSQAHFSRQNDHLVDVLRVKFDDVVDAQVDKEATPAYRTYPTAPERSMTSADAKRIVEFAASLPDDCLLVVHCGAGQSRSVGVAAALDRALNGDDGFWFEDLSRWREPNPTCYRLTIEATGGQFDEDAYAARFTELGDRSYEARRAGTLDGMENHNTWQEDLAAKQKWAAEKGNGTDES